MSREEKSEAAWRIVISTGLSKATIANAANISDRAVAYMRSAAIKIQAAHPDRPLDDLRWREADKLAKGMELSQEIGSDDWVEAEAQKIANRLCKTFGDRLAKQPEVTARALEIYSQKLVSDLAEWFGSALDDDDLEF